MFQGKCLLSLSSIMYLFLIISILAETALVGATELLLSFNEPEINYIKSLYCYQNKLYAGTGYTSAVYVFDGTTWSLAASLDNASNGYVHSLNVYNGNLFAGTNYYDNGMNKGRVWKYYGNGWTISHDWVSDNTIHHFFCLTEFDSKLYGGTGDFGKIRVFDGATWSDVFFLTGLTNVNCLAVYNSKMFCGTYLYPSTTNGDIYEFDGTSWSTSYNSGQATITCMTICNDKLYAGSEGDGMVFVYDGVSWSESFNSPEAGITSLFSHKGILYAGGHNSGNVYIYNGTIWSLYCSTNEIAVRSMAAFNEKLYIATEGNGKIFETALVELSNQKPIADAGEDQSAHPGDVVFLDANNSNDPDNNYPLSYQWTIIEKPEFSNAVLSNSNEVTTTIEIDLPGDYQIQCIVVDALGVVSEPDTVNISTFNSKPIANAGGDQVIQNVGSEVQLNGSLSYDPDQDAIEYNWEIIQKPANSTCVINDPSLEKPSFVPDEYGDYIIQLTVSDMWEFSDPDQVIVTFQNVKPIAQTGENQSVIVNETVYLNGSNSSDANGDQLTFNWNLVTLPEESNCQLTNSSTVEATLIPDLPGQYIVQLIVNDGTEDSDPDQVSIVAISYEDNLTKLINESKENIENMPLSVFRHKKMRKIMTRQLNNALFLIDRERYKVVYIQLKYGFLRKINGCFKFGSPDKNDWIQDCEAQEQVFPLIGQVVEYIEGLF